MLTARCYCLVDQPTKTAMDRRDHIIQSGLSILREHGYSGFTQPRVAALAGLRQSHLTYYHPTRLDLLAAIGRAAVDRQLIAVDVVLAKVMSAESATQMMAQLLTNHGNTRILMALAQAADETQELRELFRELADGIVSRLCVTLTRLGHPAVSEELGRLFHALLVGLAVVDLATSRTNGKARMVSIIGNAFLLMMRGSGPATPPPSKTQMSRTRERKI